MNIFRIGKPKSTPDEVFGTHSQDLCFQQGTRSKQSDERKPDQSAKIKHWVKLQPIRYSSPVVLGLRQRQRPIRNIATRSWCADVRRFIRLINAEQVFGAHSQSATERFLYPADQQSYHPPLASSSRRSFVGFCGRTRPAPLRLLCVTIAVVIHVA
jgi:hypothetical protein